MPRGQGREGQSHTWGTLLTEPTELMIRANRTILVTLHIGKRKRAGRRAGGVERQLMEGKGSSTG